MDLSWNKLSLFRPTFSEIHKTSLRTLNLSENRLRGLSDSILWHLVNLEHFDISFNRFDSFPYSPGQLPNLRTLNIIGNPIRELSYSGLTGDYLENVYFDWPLILTDAKQLDALCKLI